MVSVIIPIYNTAQYLPECINSVLEQTCHNYEIILVDDGSIDDSGRICDEYAKKDNRIRVIHQENGGVTKARKTGVESAKGEWICFVDGDDTIPKDSLETLMSATGNNTDIVVARCDDRKIPESMSLEEYRRCCIAGRKVHSGPFARAFRSRLISSKIFEIPREIVRGEDLIMNVRVAFATDKAPVLIDKKVYNYRTNNQSVMHTFREPFWHMVLFQEYLSLSVPTEQKKDYFYELLHSKMGSLVHFATDNVGDKSYIETPFYYELLDEMKRCHQHFSIVQKLLLSAKTPFQLRLVYRLIHIMDIVLCWK